MAENRAIPAGEDRRHAAPVSGYGGVTHRVNALMQVMQPAVIPHPRDSRPRQPHIDELPRRHHPVPPPRQRRNLPPSSRFLRIPVQSAKSGGVRPRGTSVRLRRIGKQCQHRTESSSPAPASTTSRTSTSSCPATQLIVITGLSGSGKSSLAFDTHLRRGAAALRRVASRPTRASSSARWRSPTSTRSRACRRRSRSTRRRRSRNPRSTVGTVTEIYDYLRLLFARIGVPALPQVRRGRSPARPSRADRRPSDDARRRGRSSW